MSAEKLFYEPVVLKSGNGEVAEIRTLDQALELLREGWPETRGKWYYAANRACDDAASGRASVHIARRIFVYAVEESRLSA